MKKTLAIVLALVFVLSIAGTAFAASNPFVDVPAKHWAYDAVSKLAKAGIVDGYGDGTFRGDKTMTRYEMAQIVAKAMAKSDKADAANKALIDKLAVEFAKELNNLGVRVAKLEKNASTIKFTGDSRIRYQQNYDADTPNGVGVPSRFDLRLRIKMSADVAENVTFQGRLDAQNRLGDNGGTASKNDEFDMGLANFTFKNVMPLSNLTIGRQNLKVGHGLLATIDYFDAVKLTFGNELKGFIAYGDARYAPGPNTNSDTLQKLDKAPKDPLATSAVNTSAEAFSVLGLQYAASKNVTLFAGALDSATNGIDRKIVEFGFTAKLNPEFALKGDYLSNRDSNVKTYNTGYWTELAYKGADAAKPGSWGAFVNYRKMGGNSYIVHYANVLDFMPAVGQSFKGMGYGFNYTVAKNAVFQLSFEDLKYYGTSTTDLATCVYAQMNFNF